MVPRILIQRVESALEQFPVVGLVGSRQSGKTTLAKILASRLPDRMVYLDLELPSDLAKLAEPELYLESHVDRLVILDEIQRIPELFPVLRALIDRKRQPGRFLILGSASPDLLQQGSETLAGRITFLELSPFLLPEVASSSTDQPVVMRDLWLRGGYPGSFLASSNRASYDWRMAFISTFLERDIPQMGFRVPATRMRRFWEMLAHVHGRIWNASTFAQSLDVTAPTIRHHLDVLTDTLLVRQLQPMHANLKKRLVKSPKVYIRDTGLLHALLRIVDIEDLYSHPVLGASFEGFAIEQIIQMAQQQIDTAFYRTHTGDEIDLVLTFTGHRRIAVEVKYTATPKMSHRFRQAMDDVGASRGYIVTAGTDEFPLASNVWAIPLYRFLMKEIDSLV
jgi:predicted AAA+ superfamily ATPase